MAFESISNLYGNSFAKDASKIITSYNPLSKGGTGSGMGGMAQLAASITVIETKDKDVAKASVETQLHGDTSWAEGLFD